MTTRLLTCLSVLMFFSTSIMAENWPSWRGPLGTSIAQPGDYPTQWTTTGDNTKNLKWKVQVPGKGSSTPAVWGDNIFVTYNLPDGKNSLMSLNREGEKRWSVEFGAATPGKYGIASGANPSPITDGENVYVFYKSGDLAAVDFKGDIVWQANIQTLFGEDTSDTIWWDMGTSPVLTQSGIAIAYQRSAAKGEGDEQPPVYSDNSFVVSFDKKTGKVNWKQDRNLKAPRESAQSYTTPLVVEEDGNETIVVLGADFVTSHDAQTGKEVWRFGTLNPNHEAYWRSIASATYSDGVVFAPYARGGSLTAIKVGGSGNVTDSHMLWQVNGISSDCATPVANNGKVYSGTDRGQLACVDVESGEIDWQIDVEKSGKRYKSSLTMAGNLIYWPREDGTVFVVDVSGEPKVVGKSIMEESVVASPVLVDGLVIIRTLDGLYCMGK